MRYAGTSSWRMWIEDPQALLIGLFVRDAAGLAPHTEVRLPPLVPEVDVRAGLAPLAVPEATAQWARWWEGELLRQQTPERGYFAPDAAFGDGQELGALTRACFDDAVRWSAVHRRDQIKSTVGGGNEIEGDLVRAVEVEIGRKARPFDLQVTQLPVAGATGWRISRQHVMVSRALRQDPAAYGRWLTPVIRELA